VASERAPGAAVARAVAGRDVPRLAAAPAAAPGTPAPGPQANRAAAVNAAVAPGAAGAAAGPAPVDSAEALRKAIDPADSPARGNPGAPVTIVAYSEFQCPFCARAVPTLRELEKAYPDQIRVVWKHLPLPFHESAALAAEAALAAGEQGKFWEMHDRLFASQDRLDPPALEEHARALGLDVPRFKAALDGARYRPRVEADLKLARDAGISGTPTFFINGEKLVGSQPLAAFSYQVDVALAKVKGLPPPAPPATLRPGGEMRPGGPRPPMAVRRSPFWPPLAMTLPDAVLGERVPGRFATGDAPVRGNPRAPVEVLYFTNLASTEPRLLIEGLLSTDAEQVKVVAKLIPLGGSPGEPQPLLEAGHYAHSQGKFWEFHDALPINGIPPADQAQIEQAASKAGLDLADLRASLEERRFQRAIDRDLEAVRAAKLGLPAILVNGRLAEGAVALGQLVDAALRKAGRKPPERRKLVRAPVTGPQGMQGMQGTVVVPGEPGYEPQRLLMGHVTPRQLFAYEPRDSGWAGAVEKALGPVIDKDLRTVEPGLGSTTVECRTSLCRLRWRTGKADDKVVAAAARLLYAPGARPTPGEVYLVLRSATIQSAEDAVARVKGRRSTVLYNHRTGRASGPLPFAADRLPRE
jgi:protein-disulfide isomerase